MGHLPVQFTALAPNPLLRPVSWWLARGHQAASLFRCDVVFGSPANDCRGTGICKILVTRTERNELSTGFCRPAPALLTTESAVPGAVSVLLLREFLCVDAWRRHLRYGTLEMTEGLALPEAVCHFFGWPDHAVLPPGSYPLESLPGYYRLTLPVEFSSRNVPVLEHAAVFV